MRWHHAPSAGGSIEPLPLSLYICSHTMNSKKLEKIAKINGWTKHRNGSSHMIYIHEANKLRVTIPYSVRDTHVEKILTKQLEVA